MSHLPLDARAILQHLNELGYRNVSPEQLREFLKGMQPQSDKQSASNSRFATATTAATNPQQQQPQPQQQRSKVKIIKSKRPLCHFKFYLDICDHQLTKRIEAEIKALGGTLEFFLNDSITHFITDKDNVELNASATQQRPGTPLTPTTPNTPTTTEDGNSIPLQRRSRQTRADAILSRVRGANNPTDPHPSQEQQKQKLPSGAYTIWQTEYALRFFRRIQIELRQYLQGGGGGVASVPNIQLKGNFIKIESIQRNNRPFYHLLKQPHEWPRIDLSSEDSAFRLQAKTDVQSMTRKSLGSRTSQRQQEQDKDKDKDPQCQPVPLPLQHVAVQALKKKSAPLQTPDSPRSVCRELKESSDKQCGVCEICKIEYDTLTIHLQSKDHERFAKNAQNFLALDTLIQVSASVKGFLERENQTKVKLEQQTDDVETESETEMEVDELSSDSITKSLTDPLQTSSNNNNRQRPSPALREKSKRITKGKHSSEKFQATPNTPPNPLSPGTRKPTTACSLVELQRMEQTVSKVTTGAATPTNPTQRRKTQNSVLSPPIRAMLPPSSLYKVVEASDAVATPPRIRRGAGPNSNNAMDSPSLIVKFQKVRQSELMRLNGEAENFMFPRTTPRSSSELATDTDRQTTSDARGHHSISSLNLDSTSEVDVMVASHTPVSLQKRATVVGRRRKAGAAAPPSKTSAQLLRQLSTGSSSSSAGQPQQCFPNAPIQPEIQQSPLKPRRGSTTTAATRKSSRTATAIVTAATTSSQLQLIGRRGAKLEDRMGEYKSTKRKKMQQPVKQELDEGDVDDEVDDTNDESSCSSGSDEDYVATGGKLNKSLPARNRFNSREERAAKRLSRLTISRNRSAGEEPQIAPEKLKKSAAEVRVTTTTTRRRRGRNPKQTTKNKMKQSKKQQQTTKASTTEEAATTTATTATTSAPATLATDLIFDCSKSERLQRLKYSFEELPTADLWHRVFQRQDAGEEQYYSYYGSTRYRKLPYELGPVPLERTKSHSCTMCRQQQQQQELETKPKIVKLERDVETEQIAAQSDSNQTAVTATTTTTTSSMYKHKKLHLLQRYQQEQQQQTQLALNTAMPIAKCDSKASTPELLEREFAPLGERASLVERVRAASTQSSTSSSCSNSQKSGATCRNKQLARIAELPPRKSPREHASTLALVSCIIRQRQDSQSKTNSEAEEQPPTPTATIPPKLKTIPLKQEQQPQPSLHNTRSQAATPVEELRFATEISETVKRMRRGQNKYDSLPTPAPAAASPVRTPLPARCRRPTAAAASYSRRLEFARREVKPNLLLGKRNRRQNPPITPAMRSTQQQQQPPGTALLAGVRKLPSKKGILEYEMDKNALKTLDASMHYVNPMLIAWQIDKYLELNGREYDLSPEDVEEVQEPPPSNVDLREAAQTPPPTDCCFTSDFDLCDLLAGSGPSGDDDDLSAVGSGCRRNSRMNLYSSYQRKRKCLKSNRTGWPRVQRRRPTGVVNPRTHQEKPQDLKLEPLETEEEQTTTTTTTTVEKEISKEQDDDDDDDDNADTGGGGGADDDAEVVDKEPSTRDNAVMTPPATDVDDQIGNEDDSIDEVAVAADNDSQGDGDGDDDDNETMADSVDQQLDDEAEIEATDADVEEDDADDDIDEDVYKDAYGEEQAIDDEHLPLQAPTNSLVSQQPPVKRARLSSSSHSTTGKLLINNHSPTTKKPERLTLQSTNGYRLNATSTPSKQQQHQQRRTPQLNGSLGSCISPSEKLGDNSDIFTVSSDGLDTDMDLSNTQAGDSTFDHCPHQQQTTTPKRKYDIAKYAPPNNGKASSSCAAEAATAAAKSLAISQFLKKEVRVTCRRLRAPFRRFRYRR